VCDAERERRITARLYRDPEVGVDCGGIVLRPDEDDLRALVARLREEVHIRNLRVERIATPDQDQVREEEVIARAIEGDLPEGLGESAAAIADLGIHVEARGVEQQGHGLLSDRHHTHGIERPQVEDDAVAPFARDRVEHRSADLPQGLLPADPLPAARASLTHAP
jgi:hypothetical protein